MSSTPEKLFIAKFRAIMLVRFCREDGNSPGRLLLLNSKEINFVAPKHIGISPTKKLLAKFNRNNSLNSQMVLGIWLLMQL
jgi:hypothetical protein